MKASRQDIVFTRESQWTVKRSKTPMDWTMDRICDAINISVSNAYVLAFGEIMLQTKGIGMGNDDSPGAANIFFAMLESEYVDNMIRHFGRDHIRDHFFHFKHHRRYIDDLFAPVPPSELPSAEDYCGLEMKVTYSGHTVVYIGIESRTEGDYM
ncbi:MAG: hypothetical protein EKK45_03705 [Curvibacter sp.]|nr:MAG: hypothetical protein EKK45_03705 [Curvibacter sp.]